MLRVALFILLLLTSFSVGFITRRFGGGECSLQVFSFHTSDRLKDNKTFNMRSAVMVQDFNLCRPIFCQTASDFLSVTKLLQPSALVIFCHSDEHGIYLQNFAGIYAPTCRVKPGNTGMTIQTFSNSMKSVNKLVVFGCNAYPLLKKVAAQNPQLTIVCAKGKCEPINVSNQETGLYTATGGWFLLYGTEETSLGKVFSHKDIFNY